MRFGEFAIGGDSFLGGLHRRRPFHQRYRNETARNVIVRKLDPCRTVAGFQSYRMFKVGASFRHVLSCEPIEMKISLEIETMRLQVVRVPLHQRMPGFGSEL